MSRSFVSLYRAKAGAPETAFPLLEGERRVEVAVVGGGYTGLSTALHLAEAGVDVALLEGETVGWGASGRNGGQVNPGLYPPPETVEKRYGAELGARMVALSYGAPDKVFSLVAIHGIECEARQTGTLRAAVTEVAERSVAALGAMCGERAMPTRLLDRDAMAAASGTRRYRSGLLDPRGGSLNPLLYARGLARAAGQAGATIFENSRASALASENGLWRVTTATGSLLARHVVLGTNGYTDGLWPGLAREIVPAFSAITATDPLPSEAARTILPGRSVLYEVGWTTVYYRIDAANRLLMGGRGPQRAPRGASDFAHLRDYARRIFPALSETPFPYAWSGQVAMTPDHFPRLLDLAPGLHAALGYNGRGIAMATAMGELLARRVRGEHAAILPMPLANELRPIRFYRAWPLGVFARIHYGRLRDRLDR